MGLVFFIETKSTLNQATPFNMLPLELAIAGRYIELASVLPSCSIDLSDGWTRARHIMGLSPVINLYSQENLEILLVNVPFLKKTQYKFFLAWKEFSIELIEKSSTDWAQSIVLTDNQVISEYFESNQTVHVVLYDKNQSLEEIYECCNREVIDLFARQDEKNFTQKPITGKHCQSRCLEKSFLEKTRLTSNLLCNSNEIVLAQARGRIPRILSLEDFPALDTHDAYCLNVEIMEEILSERLVDIMLGTVKKELHTLLMDIPSDFQESVDAFANRANSMSDEMKKQSYLLLKQFALDSINRMYSGSEIFLLIPTVNPACRQRILTELKRKSEISGINELRYVADRILMGGRGIAFDERKIDKKLIQFAKELASTRLHENHFLTDLIGLLASRKLSPVLKSVVVPSFLFDDIQALRFNIASGYLSEREKPSWCMAIGEKFMAVQSRLHSHIPMVYADALEIANPSHLTIVSDLPFEIARSTNGIAICQTYPTTRIPITPLRSLFDYCNIVSSTHFVGQKMKSLKNILLLNSIHKEDKVYWEFELFQSTCRQVGLNFETVTVHSSDDFIKSLNSRKPQVMIYFGHGSYNSERDVGELLFKEERLSYESFEKIERIPPVVFLMGCETASCAAFSGGLPIHLLGRGVFAVLATLFPIPADEAGAFIGRILAIVDDFVTRGRITTLSDIVFHARKIGWIRDSLESLRKFGAISMPDEARIMENASKVITDLSLRREKSLSISEAVPIFEEILRSQNLQETWKQVRQNVIPHSLFFTLLGDAHDVLIGG